MNFKTDVIAGLYLHTQKNIQELEKTFLGLSLLEEDKRKYEILSELRVYREYERMLKECLSDNRTKSTIINSLNNNLLYVASKYNIDGVRYTYIGSIDTGILIEHNVFDTYNQYKDFLNDCTQTINIFSTLLGITIEFKYGGR